MRVASTAVLLVEFQKEFCSEGGAFHDAVRDEIERVSATLPGRRPESTSTSGETDS